MSPIQFLAKTNQNSLCSSPLKLINKDSRLIMKSSLESSSSLASLLIINRPHQQHQAIRHCLVIIYTHSPKIIHTHSKDFMSLVQKLTGLSCSEEEGFVARRHESSNVKMMPSNEEDNKNTKMILFGNDYTESSFVITDKNCSNVDVDANAGQVNSCFALPIFEPPCNPYMNDIPIFMPNSAEFLCSNQHFYGCTDSLFFHA